MKFAYYMGGKMITFAYEFTTGEQTIILLWDFASHEEADNHLEVLQTQQSNRDVKLLGAYDRVIMSSKTPAILV